MGTSGRIVYCLSIAIEYVASRHYQGLRGPSQGTILFHEVTLPALAKPLTKMVTFQDYRRPLVLKRGINCSNLAVKRPCNGL